MALLAGLLWLPGFAIERAAFRKVKNLPFRGLTRLCLGIAFWISAIFFLCAAQILSLPAVGALVLASGVGAAPFIRPRRPRFLQGFRPAQVAAAVASRIGTTVPGMAMAKELRKAMPRSLRGEAALTT